MEEDQAASDEPHQEKVSQEALRKQIIDLCYLLVHASDVDISLLTHFEAHTFATGLSKIGKSPEDFTPQEIIDNYTFPDRKPDPLWAAWALEMKADKLDNLLGFWHQYR